MPSEVLDLGTPQPKQVEFLTDTHNVVALVVPEVVAKAG